MKAIVLHNKSSASVDTIDTPIPAPGEILLHVSYCGVCGSDIPRLIKDGAHFYPIVLGHEFSGTIDKVGKGVDQKLIGKQAACAPLIPDFSDPECRKGHYSLGKNYDFIGSRRQGGMAEFVTMPVENAVLLDEEVDLLQASFMEPLTVALHGIHIMDFQPGHEVAVIGAGSIGLLMVQCLKILGASKISVFDLDTSKLAAAKKLGADFCYNSSAAEVAASKEVTEEGRGYRYVFEMAGVPAAEIMALELAGPKGSIMFVGTPHAALTLQPSQFELMNRKELKLQGSWMNYSAPFPGWEWQFGAKLLADKKVKVEDLLDVVLPLSKGSEIITLLQTPGKLKGKIVLDCRA